MFNSKLKSYPLDNDFHVVIDTDYDNKQYHAVSIGESTEPLLNDFATQMDEQNLSLNVHPYYHSLFEHAVLVAEYIYEFSGATVRSIDEDLVRIVYEKRKISIPESAIKIAKDGNYDEYHYLIPILSNLLVKGKYGSRVKKINNLKFHRYYHLSVNKVGLGFEIFQEQLLDFVDKRYNKFYKNIQDSLIVINSAEQAKETIQRELSK